MNLTRLVHTPRWVEYPSKLTDNVLTSYQVMNAPHKAHLSHELIAAAASYEVS